MKVWLITDECDCGWYSGEVIKGAYSSEKKAQEALEKMDGKNYLSITELKVE